MWTNISVDRIHVDVEAAGVDAEILPEFGGPSTIQTASPTGPTRLREKPIALR
jgi:hypothetical protein